MSGQEPQLLCDECGRPIVTGEAVYTLVYKPDKGLGRHWECHEARRTSLWEARGNVDVKIAKVRAALKRIRGLTSR